MNLPHVFGEYTRSDYESWLLTPEGKKHIEEVFTPADTDLTPQERNDHKYGRISWHSHQVLHRQATPEFLHIIFEKPYPDPEPRTKGLAIHRIFKKATKME